MKKTMEISEINTKVLRKALKAVNENGVRKIVGYGYDDFKDKTIFSLGRQQKSLGFLNDNGETCYVYLTVGVQKGPFDDKNSMARLTVTYVTADKYDGEEHIISSEYLTEKSNAYEANVLEAVNGREIVFAKDTERELRLKLKLADDLI